MRRRLAALVIVAAAIGAAAAVLVALLLAGDGEQRTLVAGGTAEREVAPDVATVRLGVTGRAQTARTALREASTSLEAVIAAIRPIGKAEIQTNPARLRREPPWTGGRPIPNFRLFVASQSVTVRMREFEETGRLVDAAVAAGATNVVGPRFALADPRAERRDAVTAAVTDARRTARAMAEAAGLRLGGALRVAERAAGPPVPVTTGRDAGEAGTTPPVEPGTIPVTAAVTVTFSAET